MIVGPSNKRYIGQTRVGYLKRWRSHKYSAFGANRKKRFRLHNAIQCHGIKKFHIDLVEKVPICQLNDREKFWIKKFDTISPNGYNLTSGGRANSIHCDETRRRISKTLLEKNKNKVFPKNPRKRPEDNNLPKYLRSYHDGRGYHGYRVNHPKLGDKSFISRDILLMEVNKKLALKYLENGDEYSKHYSSETKC